MFKSTESRISNRPLLSNPRQRGYSRRAAEKRLDHVCVKLNMPGQYENHFEELARTVCERLSAGKRVRRTLPDGRVHIDRQLPFLCVYRTPPGSGDSLTRSLINSEAAYVMTSGDALIAKKIEYLVFQVLQTMKKSFGAILLVEIWSAADTSARGNGGEGVSKPVFNIFSPSPAQSPIRSTVLRLQKELRTIKVDRLDPEVKISFGTRVIPPGLPPLLSKANIKKCGCQIIGLEVDPIYQDKTSEKSFPLVFRHLHRGVVRAFRHAFFEFVRTQTTHRPSNYHALGRRAMVKAVWEVDRRLAEISNEFQFLLQITPVNTSALWSRFQRNKFQQLPVFYYRPLPVEPDLLKRKLWNIHIERLEDPTLEELFREIRDQLDVQFTMLNDIETARFRCGSLRLYGPVEDKLLKLAKDILKNISRRTRTGASKKSVNANTFKQHALKEIRYYRKLFPQFTASVEVRDDISAGLMVSQGKLLIGEKTRTPVLRIQALLQHEVGTHLLTYFNGKAQPFHQLYLGLAGYDDLQEGLAVLSEYLVGGLTRPRLRTLAARVVACQCMLDGATFIETFNILVKKYHFEKRSAFIITVRVYRAGGFTKDAVYLRGLLSIIEYIKNGGDLEPLWVGKIAARHIPIVQELQERKVLNPAPLRPRYMETPQVQKRLQRIKEGLTIRNGKDIAQLAR